MTDAKVIDMNGRPLEPATARPVTITDARLAVFMETLPRAGEDEFCSPPGLGGLWRVKWVRMGLERGVIVVHHTGRGLAYAPMPSDHRAKGCTCRTCNWEALASESHGRQRPVSRDKIDRLRASMMALQFRGPQPATIPALDDDF